MATLTNGTVTITPDLVLGWSSQRENRSVTHDVLDKLTPDVTLRPAGTRTGTLSLFFTSLSAALAAENAHAGVDGTVEVWDLDGAPEEPLLVMRYTAGRIATRSDGPAHAQWVVDVDFTEVGP